MTDLQTQLLRHRSRLLKGMFVHMINRIGLKPNMCNIYELLIFRDEIDELNSLYQAEKEQVSLASIFNLVPSFFCPLTLRLCIKL